VISWRAERGRVPALAIAGQLRAHRDIVWLGTERGIGRLVLPRISGRWIEVRTRQGFTRWLAAPVRLWRAVTQARRALAAQAGVVLGCGGCLGSGGIAAAALDCAARNP
jgi:UDP-N-acetylglucosamine:LPS N-acetylglucosamine transferase